MWCSSPERLIFSWSASPSILAPRPTSATVWSSRTATRRGSSSDRSLPAPAEPPRRPKARSDHPLVVMIEKTSAPRCTFSGDRLLEIDLPAGTRVLYPRPPLEALKDVDAAIRFAINHPIQSEPLYAKLRPGMKVVIAIDDVSLPLPPMRRPDIRERVLSIVLQMMA